MEESSGRGVGSPLDDPAFGHDPLQCLRGVDGVGTRSPIYLGFRIYQHPDTTNTVSYTSVGFMMSPDEGETWTKYDGTPIELPAKEATVDLIMRSQSAEGRVLETGSIGLSPDGVPFIG